MSITVCSLMAASWTNEIYRQSNDACTVAALGQ